MRDLRPKSLFLQPQTQNYVMSERFVSIFAGRATHELGEKIAAAYGQPLGNAIVTEFSDHEFQPCLKKAYAAITFSSSSRPCHRLTT